MCSLIPILVKKYSSLLAHPIPLRVHFSEGLKNHSDLNVPNMFAFL